MALEHVIDFQPHFCPYLGDGVGRLCLKSKCPKYQSFHMDLHGSVLNQKLNKTNLRKHTYVLGREAEARREDSFQWIPNSGIYYI